jgi:hypothetical protein
LWLHGLLEHVQRIIVGLLTLLRVFVSFVALQPPQANSWNARSPSNAGGGSPAPDDWEIDISQLHIDSKVNLQEPACCGSSDSLFVYACTADVQLGNAADAEQRLMRYGG